MSLDVEAGRRSRSVRHHLGPGGKPQRAPRRGRPGLATSAAVGRVGPVVEQRPQVDEGIAERRHVPVEDRPHPIGIARVELAVVELVVVVEDRHVRSPGDRPPSRCPTAFMSGSVPTGAASPQRCAQPGDLARDEALGSTEVGQARPTPGRPRAARRARRPPRADAASRRRRAAASTAVWPPRSPRRRGTRPPGSPRRSPRGRRRTGTRAAPGRSRATAATASGAPAACRARPERWRPNGGRRTTRRRVPNGRGR